MNSNEQILIESFKQSHKQSSMYHKPRSVYESLQFLSFIEAMSNNGSVTETANRNFYVEAALNKLEESIKKDNTFVWPYTVAPYFTPDEIKQYEGYYAESVNNAHDPDSIYRKIQKLDERLRATTDPDEIHNINSEIDALSVYSGEAEKYNEAATGTQFNPRSWDKKVRTLMLKLKTEEDPNEIDRMKQELINLGWNPEIDYTIENQIKARKRIEKIYNEKCNMFVLDIASLVENYEDSENNAIVSESVTNNLNPIHIVLIRGNGILSPVISKFTKGDFSHSAICIDNDFSKLYSFNMNNKNNFVGGFSIEDINKYPKDNRLAVFTFFVSKEDHEKISERIKMLSDHIRATSYSLINLLLFPFKNIDLNMSSSMICSQFVDSILKMAKIDITGEDSSKVDPNDLYRVSIKNSKAYKVFDGVAKDFNSTKVVKYIKKMSNKARPYTESFVNGLLADYLYPVVTEAKSPIEFTKDGDLLLTNKFINFDSEYSASHKLLLSYEKSGNVNGMKYELARLYYMNYILEKKLYHNKFLSDKEKNIKTRARVLNDFKKYLNYVLKKDPAFNFAKYYEDSIFYPHTVEIKKSTLLQLKDIISYIL